MLEQDYESNRIDSKIIKVNNKMKNLRKIMILPHGSGGGDPRIAAPHGSGGGDPRIAAPHGSGGGDPRIAAPIGSGGCVPSY